MSKTRILVVEDDVIAGEALVDKLIAMGYVVAAHATTGEEAIEQASKSCPDLVLMDIRLGGSLDGIETSAKIQERMDLPIIYLTAFTDEEILQKAKITAPYSYLIKPVRDRELQIVIEIAMHRHRMERQLKERERWLNTVLRSIGDAVIATDTQGQVTFMNGVAEQLTGWQNAEAIGKDLEQIFHIVNEETHVRIENPANRALRHGRIVGLANHTILIRRNGDELNIDDSAAPIADDQGHLTGVVLVFRDITEKRLNQLALQERTLELDTIFSYAPLGIMHINRNGAVVNVNQRLADIMGLTQAEMLGTAVIKMPLNEELRRTLQKALGGESAVYEGQYANADGTRTRFIRAMLNPVRLHSTSVDVIGTIEDITERKQAEERVRQLSQATESSPAAVVITDREGTIQYVNSRFAEITGYTSEEAFGLNPRLLKSGTHTRDFYERLWNTILSGQSWRGELCNRKKNGEIYWEQALIAPIRNDRGEFTHFVGVKEDITDRKRMESDLRASKEMAETSSRAKSVFLANMSHELRTPLNAILGYAQLFQRRRLDPDILKGMKTIQKSGEHLLTLINDILNLAKIEAGKLELYPTAINFRIFLDSITSLIHSRAAVKGLTFTFETTDVLPMGILVDETRLREVLLNLLDNAVKFTEEGHVIFRVLRRDAGEPATDRRPPAKALLRFEVEDTGVGIASDELENIFLPFVQADKTPRCIEGTGLGLAISRQLVQLMGGNLQIKSELGRGSLFWFELTLPVAEIVMEDATHPNRIITGYQGRRRRVLVVDDISSNRAVMLDMLQPLGFDISEAVDGRQAVQLAQEIRPDLILMDRYMPVMDGFEATSQIRQIPDLVDVVIIALSAGVSEEERVEIQNGGYNAFLPKPLHWSKLSALMEKHLKLNWIYENPGAQAGGTGGAV
jgi:PAS domain S-box-containing protein